MKRTLIAALVLASVVASAQTETTTAPAAAQPATATTTEAAPAAPVKKAVKKAKKKKEAKPSAQAPAAPAAPVTTEAAPAATVAPATSAVAPAAGTSTAAAPAAQAPAKKWGVSANMYSNNDSQSQGDIQTLTTVGGSYKVLPKLSVKASQTFESLTAGPSLSESATKREMIEDSNFRAAYSTMGVSSSLPGILGSNDLPVSLNYKHMNGDAVYVTPGLGGYGSAHAMIEANLSIPYTLSPKWEVSVDTQIRHVVNRAGASANSHRVLAIPTLSYTVNDTLSIWQSAGAIYSFDRNERFRNTYQRAYISTGVSINTPIKGLGIDLDVYQDKAVGITADKAESVTGFALYQPTLAAGGADQTFDAVGYEGTIRYSF